MTDLILLFPSTKKGTPAAEAVKNHARSRKTTVVSFQKPPVLLDGGLDKSQFADIHMQYGTDLADVSDRFKLREIVLVRSSKRRSASRFILAHIWNHPESTYDIDAVRLPFTRGTDPRNNPIGKNPGNIWAFSEDLTDGARGKQAKLLEAKERTALCNGDIDVEAVERVIQCHSLKGDTVYVWADESDLLLIEQVVRRSGRAVSCLPEGRSDMFRTIAVPIEEFPTSSRACRHPTGELVEGGMKKGNVYAKYFIVDCRVGLREVEMDPIDDIVTSPPYNIGYDPFNVPKKVDRIGRLVDPGRKGYADNLSSPQYHHLIQSTFQLLDERMNPTSSDVFLNIKNNYKGGECRPPFWILKLIPNDWILSDILIWRYDISYDPAKSKYKPYYEWILRLTKGKANYRADHSYLRDLYIPILKGNSRERKGLKHPAIYPKSLVRSCLQESNHRGLVVDPFLGSGTTLAVALELGRASIGFEIDEDYANDIEVRLARARQTL